MNRESVIKRINLILRAFELEFYPQLYPYLKANSESNQQKTPYLKTLYLS